MHIGIPEGIILFILFFNLTQSIIHHKEPNNSEYNGWTGFISVCILIALLTWGGFFS